MQGNYQVCARLFLTWSSLDAVRGNKCALEKRNEFVLGFEEVSGGGRFECFAQVDLDSSGHGVESWRDKSVYKKHHTDEMVRREGMEMAGI